MNLPKGVTLHAPKLTAGMTRVPVVFEAALDATPQAALIDLVVYGRLKDVTVCYRCHSEFRGRYPRTARPFDLHTADVLEQEYERRIGRR